MQSWGSSNCKNRLPGLLAECRVSLCRMRFSRAMGPGDCVAWYRICFNKDARASNYIVLYIPHMRTQNTHCTNPFYPSRRLCKRSRSQLLVVRPNFIFQRMHMQTKLCQRASPTISSKPCQTAAQPASVGLNASESFLNVPPLAVSTQAFNLVKQRRTTC